MILLLKVLDTIVPEMLSDLACIMINKLRKMCLPTHNLINEFGLVENFQIDVISVRNRVEKFVEI